MLRGLTIWDAVKSRRIRSALKDTELADEIEEAEKAEASDPKGSRARIQAAVEQCYTEPVRETLVPSVPSKKQRNRL
jgi:hypothetical protein